MSLVPSKEIKPGRGWFSRSGPVHPKRLGIGLTILLILLLAVLASWVWQNSQLNGPVYRGKRLRAWLQNYDDHHERADNTAVTNAVRQIGTNAIPTLLRMIGQTNNRLNGWWYAHVGRYNVPMWLKRPAWLGPLPKETRFQGLIGFQILGPEAQAAAGALVEMHENGNWAARSDVFKALVAIEPSCKTVLPWLLRDATNADPMIRIGAARRLRELNLEPQLTLSIFISFLTNSNSKLSPLFDDTLMQLSYMGPKAKGAVPLILPLIEDPRPNMRKNAMKALIKIDPEAAASYQPVSGKRE